MKYKLFYWGGGQESTIKGVLKKNSNQSIQFLLWWKIDMYIPALN